MSTNPSHRLAILFACLPTDLLAAGGNVAPAPDFVVAQAVVA